MKKNIRIKKSYERNTNNTISILNRDQIISDSKNVTLLVYSRSQRLNVIIKKSVENITENVPLYSETFKYSKKYEFEKKSVPYYIILDISEWVPGWYCIKIENSSNFSYDQIWINKIEKTPSVLVSTSTINQAQYLKSYNYTEYKKYMIENYSPAGRYFYSVKDNASVYPLTKITHDDNRIIMVPNNSFSKKFHYNAVTIIQHGIQEYYPNMTKGENFDKFITSADWLVNNINTDGSYRHNSYYFMSSDVLKPGWVSGMAQGEALSLLSRAYILTHDRKYLETGLKVLKFMITRRNGRQNGCATSLNFFTKISPKLNEYNNYIIYEEYIATFPPYVLNGDLFALVGLYDWATLSTEEYGKSIARSAFEIGCASIEMLLPYYDYYVYTSYSLLQYTSGSKAFFSSPYAHDCHIFLLNTLYQITNNKTFKKYLDLFELYSNG